MSNPRLDEWLVENGHYKTRARARDAIQRGCITMAGDASVKPSRKVTEPEKISIRDDARSLVSRAGLKLVAALERTSLSPHGKLCLDLGASTGGFCQVLLENGARHVIGLDVGHGQMDASIRAEPNITCLEGINARDLTLEDLDRQRPEFLTSDMSFISLRLALPPALELAAPGATGIFLVKPQFEVGKEGIGRGGIVRDETLARSNAEGLCVWLETNPGWECTHFMPSPIKGGDGNTEFLMAGRKS